MIEVKKTSNADGQTSIFCPLVKVDEVKREVWGVVTGESPDRDGEVCDYETTVPYYKEMVEEMSKATDGKNIFPLRAMHGLVAAGKGISIEFRKEAKEIYMGFKVVDDVEWKKCTEGVYTGFSQGGRYIKKWKDGDFMRYTAKPIEASLVDVPCLPTAHFDYVKADGTHEIRKFVKSESLGQGAGELPQEVQQPDDVQVCSCNCESCKMGDHGKCSEKCEMSAKAGTMNQKAVKYLVTGSDGKGHLPYTKDDGKPSHRLMGAAWAALFNEKGYRGNKYDGPDKEKAKKKLKQLYAQQGLDTPTEKAETIDKFLQETLIGVIQKTRYGYLNKGMYSVNNFSRILEDLKYLWLSLEYEREDEGDESPVTDQVKEAYENLLDHFLTYCEEEIAEEKEHPMMIG